MSFFFSLKSQQRPAATETENVHMDVGKAQETKAETPYTGKSLGSFLLSPGSLLGSPYQDVQKQLQKRLGT